MSGEYAIKNAGKGLGRNVRFSKHTFIFNVGKRVLLWRLEFERIAYLEAGESRKFTFQAFENEEPVKEDGGMMAALCFPKNRSSPLYVTYEDQLGRRYYSKFSIVAGKTHIGQRTIFPSTRYVESHATGVRDYPWRWLERTLIEKCHEWIVKGMVKFKAQFLV